MKTTEDPIWRTSAAGAMMLLSFGLRTVVNLLVVSLASRFLGQDELSLWLVLQSIAMYVALAELGIAQSISNYAGVAFVQKDGVQISRIISTAFGLYWLIVLPAMLALGLASWLLPLGRWLVTDMPSDLVGAFQLAFAVMA